MGLRRDHQEPTTDARVAGNVWNTWWGAITLAWRRARFWWFESMLVVVGLAVGAATLAVSMTSMITAERALARLARHPDATAVTIQPVQAGFGQLLVQGAPPVLPLVPSEHREAKLTVRWVQNIRLMVQDQAWVLLGSMPRTFVSTAALGSERATSTLGTRLAVLPVGGDYFAAYGIPVVAGQPFGWEAVAEGQGVIVLNERFARVLSGDDGLGALVGQQLFAFGRRWTVVGIASASGGEGAAPAKSPFVPEDVGGWVPWGTVPGTDLEQLDGVRLVPLPDTDPSWLQHQVELELERSGEARGLSVAGPTFPLARWHADVFPAMASAASLALLVAALTGLNLILARTYRRRRTFALAVALGASRTTVFWEVLADTLLLGGLAGLLGCAGAFVLLGASKAVWTQAVPLLAGEEVLGGGLGTVFWAVGASLGASLIMGIFPAYQAARGPWAEDRVGTRTVSG